MDKVLWEHIPVGDMKSSVALRQKCFVSVTPNPWVNMSGTRSTYSGSSSGFSFAKHFLVLRFFPPVELQPSLESALTQPSLS